MNLPDGRPVANRADWLAVRDACLKLVADGPEADGNRLDRFTRRLSRLDPTYADRLADHIYATGHELGRHVYAKRVAGDDFGASIAEARRAIEGAGWAQLETEKGLHRSGRVGWTDGEVGLAPEIRDPLVLGTIEGIVTEALNTRVDLTRDGDRLRLALASDPEPAQEGDPP